jgi:hypothetical protein
MSKSTYKKQQFTVRPDDEQASLIDEWLKKNPGWSRANLGIQAVMKFITEKQVLEPVEEKKEKA